MGRIKGLNSVPKERREKLEGGPLFFTLLFSSTSIFFLAVLGLIAGSAQ